MSITTNEEITSQKYEEKPFYEEDLIGILLPYLKKLGVDKIIEDEIAKKLYYYYNDYRYNRLFLNVNPIHEEEKVDIRRSMYNEKYLSGQIGFSIIGDILQLKYDADFDIDKREKNINTILLYLIKSIAEDIARNYQIEKDSPNRMNIYGMTPEKKYRISSGQHILNTHYDELITDGDIASYQGTSPIMVSDYPVCEFGLNPIIINRYNSALVKLRNCSFVIIQNIKGKQIVSIKIYTNIKDRDVLEKLSALANSINNEKAEILVQQPPFVKRFKL